MAASYPGAIKTFSAVVNGVTKLVATLFNSPYEEITAIQTELGTDVAGTSTDLKTRLAVMINGDGTLKQGTIAGWVNFNGTGTLEVNGYFNVSSVTDDSTGAYTVSWTTDFATNDYACVVSSNQGQTYCPKYTESLAVGSAGIQTQDSTGSPADSSCVSVIAIGAQ